MSLLRQLRGMGLAMGGSYPPHEFVTDDETGEQVTTARQRWFGWTTDEAKANAAREAGAVVTTYRSTDDRYSGWEVSVTEVVE